MIKSAFHRLLIILIPFFLTACTNSYFAKTDGFDDQSETLYIYEDGRMLYKQRYLNPDEVVIYDAGSNRERAAVKVYYPVRSDFYRDSIEVVRVKPRSDEAITQSNVTLEKVN